LVPADKNLAVDDKSGELAETTKENVEKTSMPDVPLAGGETPAPLPAQSAQAVPVL